MSLRLLLTIVLALRLQSAENKPANEIAAPAGSQAATASEAQAQAMKAMQQSIARQREAVRQQVASAGSHQMLSFLGPLLPAAAPPAPALECDAIAETQVAPLIASAATAQKLRPELIRAVIRQESAFRPCAVSGKGAMGLMQIMPDTADQLQVSDPFDPAENIQAGAKYLRQLLDRFGGELKLALAAYNSGPARIEGNAIPDIPETRNYVQQILKEVESPHP